MYIYMYMYCPISVYVHSLCSLPTVQGCLSALLRVTEFGVTGKFSQVREHTSHKYCVGVLLFILLLCSKKMAQSSTKVPLFP